MPLVDAIRTTSATGMGGSTLLGRRYSFSDLSDDSEFRLHPSSQYASRNFERNPANALWRGRLQFIPADLGVKRRLSVQEAPEGALLDGDAEIIFQNFLDEPFGFFDSCPRGTGSSIDTARNLGLVILVKFNIDPEVKLLNDSRDVWFHTCLYPFPSDADREARSGPTCSILHLRLPFGVAFGDSVRAALFFLDRIRNRLP